MLHKARTFLNTITVIHIEVHRKTYYYVIKNRFLYHKLKIEQHLHSTFPFELLLFFFLFWIIWKVFRIDLKIINFLFDILTAIWNNFYFFKNRTGQWKRRKLMGNVSVERSGKCKWLYLFNHINRTRYNLLNFR